MRKRKADHRTRLLRAAEKVTYRRGFESAALADIAKAAAVPLGNVYYYFQTKDQIAEAILELRARRFQKLLERLDQAGSPQQRLCAFADIKIKNRQTLAQGGCPVGTLCSELRKRGGPVADRARVLFAQCLAWMEAQFRALGKGAESRELALHLLSATQGVSVLAHTFSDPGMIEREATRLKAWIRTL